MGTPQEFGAAEDITEEPVKAKKKSKYSRSGYRTGKRPFRNPDEKIVAGVSSGLSAYFGLNEPLWVRIAFVLGLFGGGVAVTLYLMLWAVLPDKTSGDKLTMKGENINVSKIATKVEEELNNLS